jgi:hypothetical protein
VRHALSFVGKTRAKWGNGEKRGGVDGEWGKTGRRQCNDPQKKWVEVAALS